MIFSAPEAVSVPAFTDLPVISVALPSVRVPLFVTVPKTAPELVAAVVTEPFAATVSVSAFSEPLVRVTLPKS